MFGFNKHLHYTNWRGQQEENDDLIKGTTLTMFPLFIAMDK